MKSRLSIIIIIVFTIAATIGIMSFVKKDKVFINKEREGEAVLAKQKADEIAAKKCVFNTVMGLVELDSNLIHHPTKEVISSLDKGLVWLSKAQHQDGGWGAGSHARQGVNDPHAVPADPATTAMVAMSLLRTGTTLEKGEMKDALKKATEFLLVSVEESKDDGSNITELTGTQIQMKLGTNIDMVLTTQYFSNLLHKLEEESKMHTRVFAALNKCVDKIQKNQDENGSTKGAGWAGVLQSSFANNALESAQANGADVDVVSLEKSRSYQEQNFDAETGETSTTDGAGIVLYSVSGSARASAKEARKAKEVYKKAKKEGKLKAEEEISVDNLVKAGMDEDQALKTYSSYEVYQSAKITAQDKNVTVGYGNNGGEEFLSFLQTGESLIINGDIEWKNWFDNTSGQLLGIQNQDGSWNGHHCITSPVFCTATCVLVLSVNNDIEQLVALGEDQKTVGGN